MQLYVFLTFFVAASFAGHVSEDHHGGHDEPSRYFGHSNYNGGNRFQQHYSQHPQHYAHQIPAAAIRHTETVGVTKTITPVITKSTTYNTHSEPAISIGHIQGHSQGAVGVAKVHPVQFNTQYTSYANPTVGVNGPVTYAGGHQGGFVVHQAPAGAYEKIVPSQQFHHQAGLPSVYAQNQIIGHQDLQLQQQYLGQPLVHAQAVPVGGALYQHQGGLYPAASAVLTGSYQHQPQYAIYAGHQQQQLLGGVVGHHQHQFSNGHFAPALALSHHQQPQHLQQQLYNNNGIQLQHAQNHNSYPARFSGHSSEPHHL